MLWEPYLEDINIIEAEKNYFTDIIEQNYKVTEIKDISTEDTKRFKATVYIENANRKNHVRQDIFKIMDTLKKLKNYPNLKYKTKHGEIPADLIQLTIYKVEARSGRREKYLISSNENFIATVQYFSHQNYKLSHTSLKGNIWKDLKFRREGDIEFGWNPNFG
ncbi:hypothetical protein [Guptibacillus spartinae]|uniref:hypothetical protein n=1 Tax=Guptibacillus spartinae TaxID=3025679 RepID=UPI0023604B10|nr:hypothetical protein [Pseudalkalibacillus spartinae]